MPHLKIDTNVPRGKIPAGIEKELCKVIADTLGKPLNYCCVTINPDQVMSFGGDDGPCGQAILMSIGQLGVAENKKHSKAIFEKVQAALGIPKTKMYIHFIDAKSADVGYDGTTFHDILG
ncbi:unnamed protein product [Orchesella dallaii]|uniref:L-dopachrome isomerase n=1 Tax=Orchesella dallaii TaxID=48710 RepID=A0ABP1S3F5_9HEXA